MDFKGGIKQVLLISDIALHECADRLAGRARCIDAHGAKHWLTLPLQGYSGVEKPQPQKNSPPTTAAKNTRRMFGFRQLTVGNEENARGRHR
jgi:hypothetical protein